MTKINQVFVPWKRKLNEGVTHFMEGDTKLILVHISHHFLFPDEDQHTSILEIIVDYFLLLMFQPSKLARTISSPRQETCHAKK